MLTPRKTIVVQPPLDKNEFEEARKTSEEARSYARNTLDLVRRDLNWLEDALTPIERSRRREQRENNS